MSPLRRVGCSWTGVSVGELVMIGSETVEGVSVEMTVTDAVGKVVGAIVGAIVG